jgi:Na+-driven multidrug efflux pump
MVPIIILWLFTGPLLKYLGFDKELSDMAHFYSIIMAIALPARLIFRQLDGYF